MQWFLQKLIFCEAHTSLKSPVTLLYTKVSPCAYHMTTEQLSAALICSASLLGATWLLPAGSHCRPEINYTKIAEATKAQNVKIWTKLCKSFKCTSLTGLTAWQRCVRSGLQSGWRFSVLFRPSIWSCSSFTEGKMRQNYIRVKWIQENGAEL